MCWLLSSTYLSNCHKSHFLQLRGWAVSHKLSWVSHSVRQVLDLRLWKKKTCSKHNSRSLSSLTSQSRSIPWASRIITASKYYVHLTFRLRSTTDKPQYSKSCLNSPRESIYGPTCCPGCHLSPPLHSAKDEIGEAEFNPLLLHQKKCRWAPCDSCTLSRGHPFPSNCWHHVFLSNAFNLYL